jgi:hypothetical protein
VFLNSCEKENIDEIIVEEPDYIPDTTKSNNLLQHLKPGNTPGAATMNCVNIQYPFKLELASGTIISINSKEDLMIVMDVSTKDKPVDFVFPLDILNAGGQPVRIFTNKELGKDFASCIPQTGWAAAMTTNQTLPACLYGGLFCFDLVYPLSLTDEAGNIFTVGSELELIDLFAGTQSYLAFILPVSVINTESGILSEIQNMDDFWQVMGECKDVTPLVTGEGIEIQGFICYELVFPTQMLDGNGNLLTVNSADEYAVLVLNGEPLELVYPFSLKDSDGNTINIDDIFDYIKALNNCGIIDIIFEESETCDAPDHVLLFFNRGGAAMSPCRFDNIYPVTLLAGGNVYNVNNITEYFQVYNAYDLNEISVDFPVSVKVNQSGEVIEFASKNHLCFYIDDCN